MSKLMHLAAIGSAPPVTAIEDVFSAYTRSGTGADVTVTTGIDMTKGYMLWSKGRSGVTDHAIYDSARGVTLDLVSNSTAAQTTQATGLKSVSAMGHTIGSLAKMNTSAATYVDFVFRKAPKFCDVVTYTGNGVARAIPHNLGSQPGLILYKNISAASDWIVVKGNSYSEVALLNTAAAVNTDTYHLFGVGYVTPSDTTNLYVGSLSGGGTLNINTSGSTFVAYVFAAGYDVPSAEMLIRFGWGGNSNGGADSPITLGWEPQWLLAKNRAASSWFMVDNMRGVPTGSADATLSPNASSAESVGANIVEFTSTGFIAKGGVGFNSGIDGFIYLAIRRGPMKKPTVGTQVYNAIARTGTGAAATVTGVGFPPDLAITTLRAHSFDNATWATDRLRGATKNIRTNIAGAEDSWGADAFLSFEVDGYKVGADGSAAINYSSSLYINWFFRRYPGVFDVVCYIGTGSAGLQVTHNLTVAPQLIIVKHRNASGEWDIYSEATGATKYLELNSTVASTTGAHWNDTAPTATYFTVNDFGNVNASAGTYVAYLFATLAGVSKVGSFTGNGTNQTINCGFTTGARFVLIKRTDAVGDWYVWDSVRGIVASTDPHLSLNTIAAEVTTDDSIDPDNSGFIVNQLAATNINVSAASYIYLSFS